MIHDMQNEAVLKGLKRKAEKNHHGCITWENGEEEQALPCL